MLELWNELKSLLKTANCFGIPLPLVRDPKKECGSVSLTLVFVASIMVILGLVGKWSGKLGIVDINNALQFFYASSALYFGRNWKSAKGDALEGSGDETAADKKPPDDKEGK